MKSSVKARLKKLERALNVNERYKCALVVHDPDMLDTFDFPEIRADYVLILPDNGHRLPEGKTVPKGTYVISYS